MVTEGVNKARGSKRSLDPLQKFLISLLLYWKYPQSFVSTSSWRDTVKKCQLPNEPLSSNRFSLMSPVLQLGHY